MRKPRLFAADHADDLPGARGVLSVAELVRAERIDRLERVDPQLAKIVELRVFGGLTIEEAARVLTVSPSTAKRDWRAAKAWLTRDLVAGVRS